MDTKALRQKILDLAIRGKLVPQDPNDEPASVLLERIRAEKQQMVKDGKLKAKDIKNDTVIFKGEDNLHYEKLPDGSVKCIEDEIPFELPERWEWCRLGVITEIYGRIGFRGYTKDDLVEIGEGAITLSPSNIINSKLDFSSCTYISWVKYDESPEIQLAKNDIVLVKTGSSYGKSAIVDKLPEKTTLNPQFVVLKNTKINSSYACMYMQSTHSQNLFREFVVGTAIPTFSQKALSTLLISCPPISEQHRIVEKLNELLSFVDTIESDKTDLQKIIQQTKSKILDLAIRGKLVPQDPNDEPASVLLERIRTEKEELIKQGKIKRDKKESVIFKGEDNSYYEKVGSEVRCIDEELPFEIPDNWEWVRLGSLFSHNTGKALNSKSQVGSPYKYITTSNLYWNRFELGNLKQMLFSESELEKCTVRKGDLLVCEGGDIGRSAIWNYDKEIRIQNHIHRLRPYTDLNVNFYYYTMYLYKVTDRINGKGIGIQGLSSNQLHTLPLPLPPLSEQQRITAKIKALFDILDSIENALIE